LLKKFCYVAWFVIHVIFFACEKSTMPLVSLKMKIKKKKFVAFGVAGQPLGPNGGDGGGLETTPYGFGDG
jgi:hypothetical protein